MHIASSCDSSLLFFFFFLPPSFVHFPTQGCTITTNVVERSKPVELSQRFRGVTGRCVKWHAQRNLSLNRSIIPAHVPPRLVCTVVVRAYTDAAVLSNAESSNTAKPSPIELLGGAPRRRVGANRQRRKHTREAIKMVEKPVVFPATLLCFSRCTRCVAGWRDMCRLRIVHQSI